MAEMGDNAGSKSLLGSINSSVLEASGLDVHLGSCLWVDNNKENDHGCSLSSQQTTTTLRIKLLELVPKEVHRRTGFCDLKRMLSYIAILSNGDWTVATATKTSMTWLEEWLFYFEYTYGKTRIRWCDYEKEWCLTQRSLRRVLRNKMHLELNARLNWAMLATVEEDNKLRDNTKWDQWFPRTKHDRVIFHDNTSLKLMMPSHPNLQKATYSDYYSGPCAKGGVMLQQCGWIRTGALCTGAIGDQEYLSKTQVFEKQKHFAENDSTSSEPFLNILDKGYRSVVAAARLN